MSASELVKLDELLNGGLVTSKIMVTNFGGRGYFRTCSASEQCKLMPVLLESLGDFNGLHWTASIETCNRLGKHSIVVHVRRIRQPGEEKGKAK